MNFATRARAKALFSVGLMDEICPPSTVYAAYNYYGGEKDIRVYTFNHHEGGGIYQSVEKVNFLVDAAGLALGGQQRRADHRRIFRHRDRWQDRARRTSRSLSGFASLNKPPAKAYVGDCDFQAAHDRLRRQSQFVHALRR